MAVALAPDQAIFDIFSENGASFMDDLAEFMWNQRFKEHSYFHFWTQVT